MTQILSSASSPHPGRRASVIGFLFVALAFLFALWISPHLPHEVPVHWNAENRVDGTMPKPWGTFISPLIMLGLWLVFLALPRLAPQGFRLDNFRPVYDLLRVAVLGIMLLMTVTQLLAAAGVPFNVGSAVLVLIGLLFVVIGNVMGKIRKNFFVGIRTPWTLADDEVWLRTHRFGGWVFVAGGLALMAEGILVLAPVWALVTIAVVVLLPFLESYRLYRKIHPAAHGDGDS